MNAPSPPRLALGRLRRSRTVRRVVLWGGASGAVIVLAVGGAVAWLYGRAASSNVGELSFASELGIPPQLEPRVDSGDRKVFDLRLEEGETEFRAGKLTSNWGANGAYSDPRSAPGGATTSRST